MTDRLLLAFAALGLVPIALSYGLVPGASIPMLLDFPVEGTNQTHVFRAIMGLYLANVLFWVIGALHAPLRRPALMTLFIFMAGLAAGRLLSLVIDGMPNAVLFFYLIAEVALAVLAFAALRRKA